MIEAGQDGATVSLAPREGFPTLKVVYFFSGTHRRASIAEHLELLCKRSGVGLCMIEVDTLVGGKDHDLLDRDAQQEWLRRVESGEFHICIFAPPCGSFSRSNYANNLKPQPVRSREHPWGYPWNYGPDRKRVDKGNEFVLIALRGIRAAQQAKRITCPLPPVAAALDTKKSK